MTELAEIHRPTEEETSLKSASPRVEVPLFELIHAYELNDTYRNYHQELFPEDAAKLPHVPVHEWGVNLTDEELEAQAKHLRSINPEKLIAGIDVDITSRAGYLFGVENVQEMMRRFPAIALEGLKEIRLQSRGDDDISILEAITGARMDGFHEHDVRENNARIVIFTDDLDEALSALPGLDTENYARIMIATRLVHEMGHALHHTLPVSLLDVWHKAASGEQAAVSEYIENAAKHKQSTLKLEDFAETARLFVLNPDKLEQMAPERFRAMSFIFAQAKH